jgi:hypothetical protein
MASMRERFNAAFLASAALGAIILVPTLAPRLMAGSTCGVLARTGRPCAGCGGTTALCEGLRGSFISAFSHNPPGAFVAIMVWGILLLALHAAVTGRTDRLLQAGALLTIGYVAVAFAWILATSLR